MSAADALTAAEAASERLLEAEKLLVRSESPAQLAEAVENLEEACRQWPGLVACLTDRAAWESLARQIRRLELLAAQGYEAVRVMETASASARGYTQCGELAHQPAGPANINCRG